MKKIIHHLTAIYISIIVLTSFSCSGQKSTDYVGTWTANKGSIQLVLTETTFELANNYSGEMTPTSKGTIEIKGDEMVQTVTHVYNSYGGEDPQDKPGWYDYEQLVAMGVRNGSKEEKIKKLAALSFKSYTSSYSVSEDKKTLKLGSSYYKLASSSLNK